MYRHFGKLKVKLRQYFRSSKMLEQLYTRGNEKYFFLQIFPKMFFHINHSSRIKDTFCDILKFGVSPNFPLEKFNFKIAYIQRGLIPQCLNSYILF